MNLTTILDPYLLIWEENDFDMLTDKYELIIFELIEIIEILEASNNKIIFNDFFISQLENYYPGIDDTLDITRMIYSFLSKISERTIEFPDQCYHDIYSEPNIINYLFPEEIQQQTRMLLSGIFNYQLQETKNDDRLVFLTIQELRDNISEHLKIRYSGKQESIPLITESSNLGDLLTRAKRRYEMNPKHEPEFGWGSPFEADDIKAKEMLFHSIGSSKGNSQALYYYDHSKKVFIVFRPHLYDTYHAYENDDLTSIPSDIKKYFLV